jgi:hypothetical protein
VLCLAKFILQYTLNFKYIVSYRTVDRQSPQNKRDNMQRGGKHAYTTIVTVGNCVFCSVHAKRLQGKQLERPGKNPVWRRGRIPPP